MKKKLIGLDIGGTKCAVSLAENDGENIEIIGKVRFDTTDVHKTIERLKNGIREVMSGKSLSPSDISAIGISCGGPLDSKKGVVMSPPNLSGWDNIPIVKIIEDEFGVPVAIHNDANASALAEWKFGAGRGFDNVIFLTFGTGLGSGLILNGKLYSGTNDNAGECGHLRLSDFGPVGYGKIGSFEGFCSGGGIAQIAVSHIKADLQMGRKVSWCDAGSLNKITTRDVAEAAKNGDSLALKVFEESSRKLGYGLSLLIDILNPEVIILGGVYMRCEELIYPTMMQVIREETLPLASKVCEIKPAALGEKIGDYAALSVAATLIADMKV